MIIFILHNYQYPSSMGSTVVWYWGDDNKCRRYTDLALDIFIKPLEAALWVVVSKSDRRQGDKADYNNPCSSCFTLFLSKKHFCFYFTKSELFAKNMPSLAGLKRGRFKKNIGQQSCDTRPLLIFLFQWRMEVPKVARHWNKYITLYFIMKNINPITSIDSFGANALYFLLA